MTTRVDFTYNGWDCPCNTFGEWGAILSRKGEQPIIITRRAAKNELTKLIDTQFGRTFAK